MPFHCLLYAYRLRVKVSFENNFRPKFLRVFLLMLPHVAVLGFYPRVSIHVVFVHTVFVHVFQSTWFLAPFLMYDTKQCQFPSQSIISICSTNLEPRDLSSLYHTLLNKFNIFMNQSWGRNC